MKGLGKKLTMIFGLIASVIVIGTSVSGWIGEKDVDTTPDTETNVETVLDTEA